jgi:hypothetical protein
MTDAPVTDPPEQPEPATSPPPVGDPDGYSDPKEGLDLRDDGGANLWIEGTRIRLRRPRGRDYRYLREALQDVIDQLNTRLEDDALADLAVDRLKDERALAGQPALTSEERLAARQRNVDRNELEEKLLAEWWLDVIRALAVNPPLNLDADDLAPWMPETTPCYLLLGHWRTIPSLSGGQ